MLSPSMRGIASPAPSDKGRVSATAVAARARVAAAVRRCTARKGRAWVVDAVQRQLLLLLRARDGAHGLREPLRQRWNRF
jgi:hypothetical protein